MAEWFYMKEEKRTGPVSLEELRIFAATGRVSADTHVWTPKFGKVWMPLEDADPESFPKRGTSQRQERTEWFYSVNGESTGPVTVDALRGLALSNTITKDTMVWNSEFGKAWEPFGSARVEVAEFLESEITKALVGPRSEYYLGQWQKIVRRCNYDVAKALTVPSWNWPAFFLSYPLSLYRFLYWPAGVLFALTVSPPVTPVIDIITSVLMGVVTGAFFNSFYLQQVHKKWIVLRNLPAAEACKAAAEKGGTNWMLPLAGFVALVVFIAVRNIISPE